MSISDFNAATESGELDLEDTALIDRMSFQRSLLKQSHKKLQYQQVKNIVSFNHTSSRNFFYWCSLQTGANKEQLLHQGILQQNWSLLSEWSNYGQNLSFNRDRTSSSYVSVSADKHGRNYATRSVPLPSNRMTIGSNRIVYSSTTPWNRSVRKPESPRTHGRHLR